MYGFAHLVRKKHEGDLGIIWIYFDENANEKIEGSREEDFTFFFLRLHRAKLGAIFHG